MSEQGLNDVEMHCVPGCHHHGRSERYMARHPPPNRWPLLGMFYIYLPSFHSTKTHKRLKYERLLFGQEKTVCKFAAYVICLWQGNKIDRQAGVFLRKWQKSLNLPWSVLQVLPSYSCEMFVSISLAFYGNVFPYVTVTVTVQLWNVCPCLFCIGNVSFWCHCQTEWRGKQRVESTHRCAHRHRVRETLQPLPPQGSEWVLSVDVHPCNL